MVFSYRNSKSSQDVVDFINCRMSEKSVYGPPTADDLVAICKSVSVKFVLVTSRVCTLEYSLIAVHTTLTVA